MLVAGTHPALIFRAKWITYPKQQSRGPSFSPPAWMERGLCAQLPPKESDALFFGVEHREAPGTLIAAVMAARRICTRCPVLATCLTYALVNDERYGIRGATSGRQREKLRVRLAGGADVGELVVECLGTNRAMA